MSRACYYHICDMRRIRRFLTPFVAKTIATSLIGSKLDYCNSVLFNVTEKDWLPDRHRIKFKLCSLTYQALTSGQPVYIRNMLQPSRKVGYGHFVPVI